MRSNEYFQDVRSKKVNCVLTRATVKVSKHLRRINELPAFQEQHKRSRQFHGGAAEVLYRNDPHAVHGADTPSSLPHRSE